MKLEAIRFDDLGFFASFDAKVGELEQGKEIYLQLPANADSQHDLQYGDETAEKCVELVGDIYSDEDLSVMNIIGDTNIYSVTIREVTVKVEVNDEGMTDDYAIGYLLHLADGDAYIFVRPSAIHKYYTGSKAWEVDPYLNNYFDEYQRAEIYKNAGDKAY